MSDRPRTTGSVVRHHGPVFDVVTDTVEFSDGVHERDVVRHPGAVGVVALDDRGRVALIEQYRHSVAERLWELPAGLLDLEGESAARAAARELEEEAGLRASDWTVLVDTLSSPGMSNEATRVFLARGLLEVERPAGEAEEAELILAWVDLSEACGRVLAGEVRNAMACVGLLAAARVVGGQGIGRPADAPWPDRPNRAPAAS